MNTLHCSSNSCSRYVSPFYLYSADCYNLYGKQELNHDFKHGQVKKTAIVKFKHRCCPIVKYWPNF
jgi:hypothetical protein